MKEITENQILARLNAENPWWKNPHMVSSIYGDLQPRPYLKLLYPLLMKKEPRRAIVLMGPRRVGKTYLIHHVIQKLLQDAIKPQNIFYVSMDQPIYNDLDLDMMLELYSKISGIDINKERSYIFFDEIQYHKDWERFLKAHVDHYPNLKILASGSAAAALKMKSIESGAGRLTDFMLPPLTFYEFLYLLNSQNLVLVSKKESNWQFTTPSISALNYMFVEYLNFGGYPEVIFSNEMRKDPSRFIKSDIIDKVLLRDLPSLYGIQDIPELNRLFTTLAYNTGFELSLEGISAKAGLAKNTIRKYIEYLEAAFLIKVVHRVDINARTFKRANNFKVYLTNPSIRAALFSPISETDESIGSIVETAVFSQWFHGKSDLHYARWKGGEVDIVNVDIATQKAVWAIEVKWSDRFFEKPKELESLIEFCNKQRLKRAISTTKSLVGLKSINTLEIDFRPAALYCFGLGYNIIEKALPLYIEYDSGNSQFH